ncbi:MAG: phosphatase PAP2 family protein [Adhaeribacter sp.]
MKNILSLWLCLAFSAGFLAPGLQAQDTDTTRKYQDSTAQAPFFKKKAIRAVIVPTLLIGYGLSTIKGSGLYSSYEAQRDLQRAFPNFHTRVDDILIYAPFAELVVANLVQVKSNHDFLNTTLLILKAEAINNFLVFGLKNITKQERPNKENSYSLPSGHTANAFLAASILHTELRHKSNWYGVGAYTIATGVGALRMLNNKHWQADVLTGAGIGILSAHAAYLSHRNRWGRKPTIVFTPTLLYGTPAIGLSLKPEQLRQRRISHQHKAFIVSQTGPRSLPLRAW